MFILGLTILASLLAFNNDDLQRKFILNPYLVHHRQQWWRMISSGMIHADFLHLFVNMFALYGFGMAVESYYRAIFYDMGTLYFLVLYFGGIIIANAPTLAKHKENPHYNSLGASGAVSAIIFAAIIFQPWSKIYFFGIIGIPGILIGPLYLFFEYRMSQQGGTGINHDAHFWGAIFGVVFTLLLKPSLGLYFMDQLMNGF